MLPRRTREDVPFVLNLNVYRNSHYHILNQAKKQFKLVMTPQIEALPLLSVCSFKYIVYPASLRDYDGMNVVSIVDKFLCDAIIELKKIPDDSYKYIRSTSWEPGNIAKHNPKIARIECIIKEEQ